MRSATVIAALLATTLPATAGDGVAPAPQDVTYPSGDVVLAASLLVPPGAGPFPAAVIVHGSGTSDRTNVWTSAYAAALVERGIVVLHPDKRGSGASGGDWRTASFERLADDVLAGVHRLREDARVDETRLAIIGFSQGGHVVPIAAAASADVKLVVDVSGSVVPLAEQIGDEIRLSGERQGLTADELAKVRAIHESSIRFALTGHGWDAYTEALDRAKESPIGDRDVVRGFPSDPESWAWGFLRAVGDFDPRPHWREVHVPSLFVYGGQDRNVDVAKSVRILEQELGEAGLSYSVLLFGNNGHALFREDAMDFIARWIRDGGAD